jgi:L-alanine-DL-glutamate epimerase-like enolase superfamily enzyme
VIGEEVTNNVKVWHAMRQDAWWYGHGGGFVSFAISAIDIALWDLRGKVTGQSVGQMIGRQLRDRLPAIASTHAFRPTLEEEAAVHGRWIDEGYQGVKVGLGKRGDTRLGYEVDRDIEFMRQLRDSVGPQAAIMLDRGQSLPWDLEEAVRRTHALEGFGLKWMEEPFEPEETNSYQAYRDRVTTMIGIGEREWDEAGFRRLIDSGIVDVVGCDPGRAQGITGSLKVVEMVEQAGLWFNAHTWSSAIVTAASLALSASTPRCLVFELKPMRNPMQHDLVTEPITQHDGWVIPRTLPGLGITVDEHVVESYRTS